MKQIFKLFLISILSFSFAGCRSQTEEVAPSSSTKDSTTLSLQDKKILIAYFTRAENVPVVEGMDTSTSASTVLRDDKMVGNTGFVANVIQEHMGGTLYPIKVVNQYTSDYEDEVPLQEQNEQARPEVEDTLGSVEDYDVIFLGFPNWWHDMPMAMYTFLESHDFDGKIIIPFITHGGSGLSNTIETIQSIYPKATVLDGLAIYQHDVPESEGTIISWLDSLSSK